MTDHHTRCPRKGGPSHNQHPEVLNLIHTARHEGRQVYLASATRERLVSRISDYLGVFNGWFATDEMTNCAAEVKAEKLVAAFSDGGFDYVGNDAADLPVWRHAGKAYAMRSSARVARRFSRQCNNAEHLAHDKPTCGLGRGCCGRINTPRTGSSLSRC
jgi:phosphoserine phosphatase